MWFFSTWEIRCISAYFLLCLCVPLPRAAPGSCSELSLAGGWEPLLQPCRCAEEQGPWFGFTQTGPERACVGEGCGCPEHLLVPSGHPHPCPRGGPLSPAGAHIPPTSHPHPSPHNLCLVPPFEGLEPPESQGWLLSQRLAQSISRAHFLMDQSGKSGRGGA